MPPWIPPAALLAPLALAACATPTTPPMPAPQSTAPVQKQCDAFTPCPVGQHCLLGSCEPISCRATVGCVQIGLCSLRGERGLRAQVCPGRLFLITTHGSSAPLGSLFVDCSPRTNPSAS